MSQQHILNSDGLQIMKEYAKDLGVSQYTIVWYTTDGNHNKYEITITADQKQDREYTGRVGMLMVGVFVSLPII